MKKATRILAMILAVLLAVPSLAITMFADGEATEGENTAAETVKEVIWSENFQEQTVGDYIAKGDSGYQAKIKEDGTNKYWEIPVFGYDENGNPKAFQCTEEGVEVKKCKCGNINKNLIINNPAVSNQDYEVVTFAADYYIPADAHGHMTVQFRQRSTVSLNGAAPAALTWFDLYTLDYQTAGKATFKVHGDTNATYDKAEITTGGWITIAMEINLVTGAMKLYANGELCVTAQLYKSGSKITNINIAENDWTIYKTTNNRTTQNLDKGAIRIDNVEIYTMVDASKNAVYGEQNFDALTAGAALATTDGFEAVHPTSTVKEEEGNKFVRIPFVGGKDSGNWDKSLQVKHKALTGSTSFTVEVDYRPHYNNSANVTLEAQFRKYGCTGPDGTVYPETGCIFMNLYKINLATGELTNCGTVVDGAEGMKLDEWNKLTMIFDMATGHYRIYVNGALYAYNNSPTFTTSAWVNLAGCKDVTIGENMFIAAKCNKVEAAYTATDLGEGTSYVDVDNIKIYETREAKVTVDGESKKVMTGDIIDLTVNGVAPLWSEITVGEETYTTTASSIPAVNGMKIVRRNVSLTPVEISARVKTPLGLRFVTGIDKSEYSALKANENVAELKLGTIIAPKEYVVMADDLTPEGFGEGFYLDVPATPDKWYGINADCYLFAGSIVDLYEHNYNREFIGIGYLNVTMKDGTVYTVYSATKENAVGGTLAEAAKTEMEENNKLSDLQKEALKPFADAYEEDMEAAYERDLTGLNVLAIGDSLYSGSSTTVGAKQWINLLGNKYGWNLTNLGIGGATISYKAGQSNYSMYQHLMTDKGFCYGSKSNATFYNCGNPSGDPEDVDIVILQGGSNDYGPKVGAPVGTVDSTDPSTFLGAWAKMTDELLEIYPNAIVVFMTAWENNNQSRPDGANAIEYTTSVIDLYKAYYAEEERVYIIDSGSPEISGVNMRDSSFRATYAYDSFHLNDEGMKLMAQNMLPYLWQLVQYMNSLK
ncbi:MAG: SGNH/GDSL hydrolase family protein [Clostridia bacterium]|nr:SGNH/GDSL hydrolase family protein [Clostridia bacterium]